MNSSAKHLYSQRISPYLLRRRRSLEEAEAEKGHGQSSAQMESEEEPERVDNRAFHE
ncbi:hypothetical protein [Ferruginivarius sediminum]|uniref:hypothetical protein n=1 Tax=Ferruginivarius sediminum TaxID=2661937 RepID=UPI001292D6DE|nr:hypothetical protein [Ferruginivarius sediminum]